MERSQIELSHEVTVMASHTSGLTPVSSTIEWATKLDVAITTKPATLHAAAFRGAQIELGIRRLMQDSSALVARLQHEAAEEDVALPPNFDVRIIEQVTLGPAPEVETAEPPSTELVPQPSTELRPAADTSESPPKGKARGARNNHHREHHEK